MVAPHATEPVGGDLKTLNNLATITIPSERGVAPHKVELKILPEITDTKKATYSDTSIIGRAFPIKTYSHSDNRVISVRLHFLSVKLSDISDNRDNLWAIQSATYPRVGLPYKPPPVCRLRFGSLFGGQISPSGNQPTEKRSWNPNAISDGTVCAVLETYSVTYPTNVVWDPSFCIPIYFQVNTTWHVVYSSTAGGGLSSLPNQDRILRRGQ